MVIQVWYKKYNGGGQESQRSLLLLLLANPLVPNPPPPALPTKVMNSSVGIVKKNEEDADQKTGL